MNRRNVVKCGCITKLYPNIEVVVLQYKLQQLARKTAVNHQVRTTCLRFFSRLLSHSCNVVVAHWRIDSPGECACRLQPVCQIAQPQMRSMACRWEHKQLDWQRLLRTVSDLRWTLDRFSCKQVSEPECADTATRPQDTSASANAIDIAI